MAATLGGMTTNSPHVSARNESGHRPEQRPRPLSAHPTACGTADSSARTATRSSASASARPLGNTTENPTGHTTENATENPTGHASENTSRHTSENTSGHASEDVSGDASARTSAPPSSWSAFVAAEPELARTVEARFGAFTHHVLATIRTDGSPRTSGTEVRFLDGELWFGMMPGSRKAQDLRRDPRFALQANPGEGTSMGGGDVRVSGRAVEVDDEAARARFSRPDAGAERPETQEVEPPERFHLFRAELTEVVRTFVEDETYLVLQVWKPGEPVRVIRRT